MTETYRMIRIKEDTHRKLRILAAHAGESMLDCIDRLLTEEEQRIEAGKTGNNLRTVRPDDE